jgi:protein-S-isoprenylcysteine O-methyltransferase Ste14
MLGFTSSQLTPGAAWELLARALLLAWFGLGLTHGLPALGQEILAARAQPDLPSVVDAVAHAASLLLAALWFVLVAFRRAALATSTRCLPALSAVGGTFLGIGILMLPRQPLPWQLHGLSALLMFAGTVFAIYAILHLGRSLSIMAAARKLVTHGPYKVIRHPLYLGEEVALAGLALQYLSPAAILLLVVQLGCQLRRIRYEEDILRGAFPDYENYCRQTPRLFPALRLAIADFDNAEQRRAGRRRS